MKNRRLWLGGTLLVLGVIAAMVAHHRWVSHPKGSAVAMVSVSADSAVFAWRSEEASTSWITRVDGHGVTVWVQSLSNVAMSIGSRPLTIVDGVVVFRYGRKSEYGNFDSSAIAFDLTDGHVLWDHVLVPDRTHEIDGHTTEFDILPTFVSDVAAGKAVFSFAGERRNAVVARTIARTGVVTWSHPSANPDYFSPITYGDDLALHEDVVRTGANRAQLTTGGTGVRREVQTLGTGCALGTEYLVVEPTEPIGLDIGARLVAYASGDAKPRVLAATFGGFDGHSYVRACGHHRDDLVFLVESPEDLVEAIVTDREGRLLHRIELGRVVPIDDRYTKNDPTHAPFGGDLPRFTPFLDYAEKSFLMVDLETGATVWRCKRDKAIDGTQLLRIGTQWIWSDGEPAPTIAVFDGETGKLSAAVNAFSDEGDVSGGGRAIAPMDSLWLYTRAEAPIDDVQIAVLDLANLAPRFVRGIKITEVTSAVRTKLGL